MLGSLVSVVELVVWVGIGIGVQKVRTDEEMDTANVMLLCVFSFLLLIIYVAQYMLWNCKKGKKGESEKKSSGIATEGEVPEDP